MTLCVLLAACEPSSPAAPTPTQPPGSPSVDIQREETLQVDMGSMSLSLSRIRQPGWSGRLVVVQLGSAIALRVVPSPRPRPLSELLASEPLVQPFAAIDGGFYDTDGRPMGLVRSLGRDVAPLSSEGGSGVLFIERGRAQIVARDVYRPSESVTEALQSIDRLVDERRSLIGQGASDRRAARSAVMLDAQGLVSLVVAFDDRAVVEEEEARIVLGEASARTGPTIRQWAALLAARTDEGGLGASVALGLDGGYSTSLVVKSAQRALTVVPFRATINALLAVPEG